MEQSQQQKHPEQKTGKDEDAPSPKDIYVYLVVLIGALLVTSLA